MYLQLHLYAYTCVYIYICIYICLFILNISIHLSKSIAALPCHLCLMVLLAFRYRDLELGSLCLALMPSAFALSESEMQATTVQARASSASGLKSGFHPQVTVCRKLIFENFCMLVQENNH